MALRGDLGLIGAPLLVRNLAVGRADAHLQIDHGRDHYALDFVQGAVQCLAPRGDGRSGALSGRVLAQLMERGSALREDVAPQRYPLRELLTRRGLRPDERRELLRELLGEVCALHEGSFRLTYASPSGRLQRAIEGEKTIAFQLPDLLRHGAPVKPTVRLLAPDKVRGVDAEGRGVRVLLDVAKRRRLNGTLWLRDRAREVVLYLVDGDVHAGKEVPTREQLVQLFAWGEGRVRFEPRRPKSVGAALPEDLAREVGALPEAWSTLLGIVSAPSAVFAFATSAAADESSQVFGLELVSQIDGKRSLRELADAANEPLEVVRTLADLVILGFVQRVS